MLKKWKIQFTRGHRVEESEACSGLNLHTKIIEAMTYTVHTNYFRFIGKDNKILLVVPFHNVNYVEEVK